MEILSLPRETVALILACVPQRRRFSCRQVSKTWLALVDDSITKLDLSESQFVEIFTYNFDNKINYANAEVLSHAERVLLTAAKNFKKLTKIKFGGPNKLVRQTQIGYPNILGPAERGSNGDPHPLVESIAKKRALTDLAPVLQDVETAVTKHQKLIETVLWTEYSLKRVRDDIDPLIIVHVVKNCPKLTDLHLYGITRVTDDILAAIVDLRPNIRQLNLINTSVSVMGLEYALKNLPNLENLSIGRTISSGYLLCSPHRNFPHDRMLELKDLPAWQKLRKLRLSYTSGQDFTPLLAKCTNLEKFHDVGVDVGILPYKCSFPKLIGLDVSYSHFDVPVMIQKHPQIEEIGLRGNVTNEFLNTITGSVAKLTKFRLSVFYDAEISDEALIGILQKHAKTLTSLELSGIRTITPKVFDIELPALKNLVVKLCSNISGKHVVKLIPHATTEKYDSCVAELMTEDVTTLSFSHQTFPAYHYYDSKSGFELRTELGLPMDTADW